MRLEVTAPALVRVASRKYGETAPVLCQLPVTVEMREVSDEEAPIVCEVNYINDYRYLDGSFYIYVGPFATYASEPHMQAFFQDAGFEHGALASIAGTMVDPDTGRWKGDARLRPSKSSGFLQLAYASRFSDRSLDSLAHSYLRSAPPELPHLASLGDHDADDVRHWTEQAEARGEDLLLIDGIVWRRTEEPMFALRAGLGELSISVADVGFRGRAAAPAPYGAASTKGHGGLNQYWWTDLEYFDINDADSVLARIEEIAEQDGLSRSPHVDRRRQAVRAVAVRTPDVFGHGFGGMVADRAARRAVHWACENFGNGKDPLRLRSRVPDSFKAAVAGVFELTAGSDPSAGVPEELGPRLETLSAVLGYEAAALDRISVYERPLIARAIDLALTKWEQGPVDIASASLDIRPDRRR